jgi:hypothetical protein
MTTPATTTAAAGVPASKPRPPRPAPRSPRTVGGIRLGQQASTEAKRLAAAILEVLAGVRTTGDAAAAVGLSLTRYYQVEARALAGFLQACEPLATGPRPNGERALKALRRDNDRLQRELARQQALVRIGQRSVGLAAVAPLPPKSNKTDGKKARRRPVSRALQVAARLQPEAVTTVTTAVSPPAATDSLQKSQ